MKNQPTYQTMTRKAELQNVIRESLLKSGFTPFTQSDWACYAGAERFPDGEDPLIKETDEAMLIFDENGLSRIFFQENPGPTDYDSLSFNYEKLLS